MNKQNWRVPLLFLFLLTCSPLLFAGEEFAVTTYYPSPDGAFNELQANKLAVGDTSLPPADGQIYAARSVIYKPQIPFPPTSGVRQGELVYNIGDSSLHLYNGSFWIKQGVSSGVSFTYYCFNDSKWGTPVCTDAGGSQKFCPSGYTQKSALGSWGHCNNKFKLPGYRIYFLPPGGINCGTSYPTKVLVGEAYLCSNS